MVKVGIVGMGFGAAVHIPACLLTDGVELVALADGGSGKAIRRASELSFPVQVFNNGEAAVCWSGLDIVCIASPATTQFELVRRALYANKHVICEKPFTTSSAQATELMKLAIQRDLNIGVCYEFRYDSHISKLSSLAGSGEFGDINRLAVTWHADSGLSPSRKWSWKNDGSQAGGVLTDWCSHAIDYGSLILESRIERVACRLGSRVSHLDDDFGKRKLVTAPDFCELHCQFENGVWATFSVSNTQPNGMGHRIELFGDAGWARYHLRPPYTLNDKSLIWCGKSGSGDYRFCDVGNADDRVQAMSGFMKDYTALVNLGQASKKLPTCKDAIYVWQVIEAAKRSFAEGQGFQRVMQ